MKMADVKAATKDGYTEELHLFLVALASFDLIDVNNRSGQ